MRAGTKLHALGLSCRFGDRYVLRRVSFVAFGGTVTAITGPSGSGKSTLLALLGGALEPTGGAVMITAGEARFHPSAGEPASRTGWVFQTTNVLPRRTALDNVVVPLLAAGVGRQVAEGRAAAALRAVDLPAFDGRAAATFSGGERQRMCIARALVSGPRLLLADEPTGQLDSAMSASVFDALRAGIVGTECIGIVVTHDEELAGRCDQRLRLVDGRLRSAAHR
ncbi:ABC transporter ATP-binding protein [Euzebya pacifica]|uniref:ABC transporter ATP-binding protein n=1 Tax=Euzebya pacifica TaxID=1608957 RepID=UPI001C1F8931|nr:ATP-binding cassette domain-containing protein [Euzebya pacifica]